MKRKVKIEIEYIDTDEAYKQVTDLLKPITEACMPQEFGKTSSVTAVEIHWEKAQYVTIDGKQMDTPINQFRINTDTK